MQGDTANTSDDLSWIGRPPTRTASDVVGAAIVVWAIVLSTTATVLALAGGYLWLAAQPLVAMAFLLWFSVLHEAGHNTLFRARSANTVVGVVAGVLTGFPFHGWRPIHHKHHLWTGYQDRDPTTQALVPRAIAVYERVILNTCWALWIPLFSVLYRLTNFWLVPRIVGFLVARDHRRRYLINVVAQLMFYAVVFITMGKTLVPLFGVGIVLGMMVQDVITLSQHTHIPMRLAGDDDDIKPLSNGAQVPFTRTLRFPDWFSRLVLLRFDEHEQHHAWPLVPGYRLGRNVTTRNTVSWWAWTRKARALDAVTFLFSNRDRSGSDV